MSNASEWAVRLKSSTRSNWIVPAVFTGSAAPRSSFQVAMPRALWVQQLRVNV